MSGSLFRNWFLRCREMRVTFSADVIAHKVEGARLSTLVTLRVLIKWYFTAHCFRPYTFAGAVTDNGISISIGFGLSLSASLSS